MTREQFKDEMDQIFTKVKRIADLSGSGQAPPSDCAYFLKAATALGQLVEVMGFEDPSRDAAREELAAILATGEP